MSQRCSANALDARGARRPLRRQAARLIIWRGARPLRRRVELSGDAMNTDQRKESLLEAVYRDPLAAKVAPRRLDRMLEVAMKRLASVRVVLENLWDPHNVSAVVRTAEGLGLDTVHVIEQPNRYRKHPSILRGADRWVSIKRHQHLGGCLDELAQDDFLTCAADVGPGCIELHEIPVDRPVAIVLGSEKSGLTMRAREITEVRFTIPMPGFTDSFNVSVSAAIALWHVANQRRQHLGSQGDLSDDQIIARIHGWLESTMQRRGNPARTPKPRA